MTLLAFTCLCLTAMGCAGRKVDKNDVNNEKGKEMKTLTVYFSYTAGNTKRIAEKIHRAVGGDLVRLETVVPYPDDYQTTVSRGQKEVESGYRPELKPLGVNLNDYDRIIIGLPTWWYRMAPAVLTFLSSNSFKGCVVVPFSTNAGWPGTVIKDMTAEAVRNGAEVTGGKEFRFSSDEKHFDRMETPEAELEEWIKSLVK